MTSNVQSASRRAGDHPALEMAARVGYTVSGFLHLIIGFVALQLAWTSASSSADSSGALSLLSDHPVGRVALWVAVVGWLGLALWQVTEAISGRGEGSDRAKAGGKAVLYLVLSWGAFAFARGGGSSSERQSADFTRNLMSQPFGNWLVGLVGAVIVGVGVYHVVKGYQRKFLDDLESHPGEWIEKAGRVGYVAKGVALAIVGGLFVLAGVRSSSAQAKGLDGALKTLLDAPGGKILLTLVALGLIAYGLYSFGRARHAKV